MATGRAKERLLELKKPERASRGHCDARSGGRRHKTVTLGGTKLELSMSGQPFDNSLVMRLPKEKLVFVVDSAPIETIQFRISRDSGPAQCAAGIYRSLKKLRRARLDRMIPGHPYAGGR